MTDSRDTMRWVWRGVTLAAILIGWGFIAWQNRFHFSAPVVFVCLGYLAVAVTIYSLWRTGAAAVAEPEEDDDSTWARPVGLLGELEREKRTLLKAIKEAEFDLQMGKLSQRDADEMIRVYRGRAIEVIKEIDKISEGGPGSARQQILREVRARLEVEARSQKKPGKADGKAEAKPSKDADRIAKPDKAAGKASKKAGKATPGAEPAATPAEVAAAQAEAAAEAPATAAETAAADAAAAEGAPAPAEATAAQTQSDDDDAMDADSTTTVEPPRAAPAKEATP